MIPRDDGAEEVFFDCGSRGLHGFLGENLRHVGWVVGFVVTPAAFLGDHLHEFFSCTIAERDAGDGDALGAHSTDES